MISAKVSSKYQIVIPRDLRRKYGITAGQRLRFVEKKGGITIETKSIVDELAGSMKGAWGKDPDSYISKSRDEWEEHQKELDALWH